ncbi:unnamed protein product [Prorocentrum cordatum]|uniref:Uncharacterized protein n=1 Tax=Prorocentrum cordatum TaxID=2364126 RepID=A0ABN9QTX9_9DINO|nr:unnamed protein product [Polarella glacialis]
MSEAAQKNIGNHVMDQDGLFYVGRFLDTPLEPESTCIQRVKPMGNRVCTNAVCFKLLPRGLETDAWRILLRVARGRGLLPDRARECCGRVLASVGSEAPADLLPPSDGPQGSPPECRAGAPAPAAATAGPAATPPAGLPAQAHFDAAVSPRARGLGARVCQPGASAGRRCPQPSWRRLSSRRRSTLGHLSSRQLNRLLGQALPSQRRQRPK